ncbi:unnamed protein product [Closterium sp. NIES-54]
MPWIHTVRLQLREQFGQDLPVLCLHSDRGGEFSSDLLRDSPQKNGIAKRRIGLVMEVARTSMIHVAAPFFLWPFAGHAPSCVSQVDPLPGPAHVQVAVDSDAAQGVASGGAEPGGAVSEGAETGVAEARGVEIGGAEPRGVATGSGEPGGDEPEGVESGGAASEGAESGAVAPGGTVRLPPYFVSLLQQVLGTPPSADLTPPLMCPPPGQSQTPLQPASPLPAPSPYTEQSGGLTERREPVSRPVLRVCTARRAPRSRPPPIPRTHAMALRPSSVPLYIPLLAPPESSLPAVPDPASDRARGASPTVARLLATAVTDPSFESGAASTLVAKLLDFAAACRLDYATALVAESVSASPPSVGGECALGTDVLEDRQEDFECLAAAVPRFASMLLAPEGDPDAPDIPTPRSYAEAITGTYVDEVPPPGANIVDGMWIFRVKRPPGSPPAFKACYVARGFSQRQGVDYFRTFSTTPKMTTLRVLLHVAAQSDYELHSLDFSTAFLQGSLHDEIWLRCPPGFSGSFPAGTQWSLRRPVYSLRQAPREWHDTLRTTLAALWFAPSTADPSLFLCSDTSLPPFYICVYVDDLVFATIDTEALTLVNSELQKRHTCTDLGDLRNYLGLQITRDRARRTITLTQSHMVHQVFQRFGFQFSSPQPTPLSTSHSLSAPPSDESVEPSGPYPELVGCLMYLMTCTRPDLTYPLSLLARYVAPGRHRKVHWDAAKRVLGYLCSTSGMGLVLGGQGLVVLTGHADASWVDDSATQRSSQGYTFSLSSGSVSWRSTRSSSVLSSSCEAEIYAGAMAAQELRWLTYLLTDLGEQPRSPPVLYVDNKAMIALCQEHRLSEYYVSLVCTTQQQTTPPIIPPLISPLSCSAAYYFAIFLRLLFFPSTSLLPSPSPPMTPILTTPSRPRRYCPLSPADVPHPSPLLPLPYASSAPLSPTWTSPLVSFVQSHQRRQSPAPPSLSVATPGADAFPSALSRCLSISLLYSCCSLSLPRTLDFVLDNGATDSVFRDAGVLCSFIRPLFIHGAGETMTLTCTGTSSLPCRVSPSGAVTGLYVPSCRHNLLSLSALQFFGVRASFPAGELYCDLHYQDRHLAHFTLSPTSRLYTLCVSLPSSAHHTSPSSAPPISSCEFRSLTQPTLLLHHRLGHPNFPLLHSMVHSKLLHDLPSSLPPLPPSPAPLCTRVQAKISQSPHPSSPSASPQPLDLVHMEFWGPSPIASRQGHRYFLLLVDDHSRFATVYPLCAKSDTPSLIIRWAEQARLCFGRPIARFHSDGGGEFFNHSLSSYCSSHGIRQTSTLPHSPEQNGVTERRNRTLMEITRCLLTHASAPRSLWSYALVHATLLSNLRPHSLRPTITPFQLWTGRQPSACPLRMWGCVAHVFVNPADRARQGGKLAPETQLCAFIGINSDCPGYLFYAPSSEQLICSQDVIFDETCSPFLTPPPTPPTASLHRSDFDSHPSAAPSATPSPPPFPPAPAPPLPPAPSAPPSVVTSGNSPPASSSSAPMPSPSPPLDASLPFVPIPPPSPRLTRSMTHAMSNFQHFVLFTCLSSSKDPNLLEDRFEELFSVHPVSPLICVTIGDFSNSPTLLSADTAAIPIPQSYSEAVSSFHSIEWMAAIIADYEAFTRTNSYVDSVPPPGATIAKGKWVFRVKQLPGELPLFKARYCAKGTVCELKRHVYGLKQALCEWHAKLTSTLHSLGFSTSTSDPSLFIRTSSHWLYILAYVDNLVLLAEDSADLAAVKKALQARLLCKDLGELRHYLGMEIHRDRAACTISLSVVLHPLYPLAVRDCGYSLYNGSELKYGGWHELV